MIFESSILGLPAMKLSDDSASGELSMKCRTAMIHARVMVS